MKSISHYILFGGGFFSGERNNDQMKRWASTLTEHGFTEYATDPAPTMLMHGTKDRIVTYKSIGLPFGKKMHGGKKMDKALTRQDIPPTLAGRITTLDATMTDSGLKPTAWAQMNMFQLYGGKR